MRLPSTALAALVVLGALSTASCRCYGKKDPRLPDFTVVAKKRWSIDTPRRYGRTEEGLLRVDVQNDGCGEGWTAVMVQFEHGPASTLTTDNLQPGERQSLYFEVPQPIPADGFEFVVTVNPGDEVAEWQYGDNVARGYCRKVKS
jgi:hypothetical protein